MTKRAPSRAAATERAVNTGAIEQAALGTTAAAMVLGILAGETHGKTRASEAAHNDASPPAPPDAFQASPSDHTDAITHADVDPGPSSSAHAGQSVETPVWSHSDIEAHQNDGASLMSDQAVSPSSEANIDGPAATHGGGHAGSASFSSTDLQTTHVAPADAPAHEPLAGDTGIAPLMPDTSFVHDTVAGLTSDIPAIVTNATAAITELTSTISSTVDTAVQSILSAPAATAGQLVDTVFHQQASPVPAADTLIDHSPLVATVAQLTPLTLGFMGQPTTDNHDTHDGAFSALGLHHL